MLRAALANKAANEFRRQARNAIADGRTEPFFEISKTPVDRATPETKPI